MRDFFVVIPAGGSGSRLWPLSRADAPKFLHDLSGEGKTLIRATWDRVKLLAKPDQVFVVTGIAHDQAIRGQLLDLSDDNLLLEPQPKDSAAAIGFAVLHVLARDQDAIIGSFAADHVINDSPKFVASVREAVSRARQDKIVAIGIRPTEPSTAFGYLRVDAPPTGGKRGHRIVSEFVEKPTYERAAQFVGDGGYFWNAGMFISKASVMWEYFKDKRPELASGLLDFYESWRAGQRDQAAEIWARLKPEAIDYVVAEPAAQDGRMEMVVGDFDWDDIGDFAALGRFHQRVGDQKVAVLGPNVKVVAQDSSGVVVSQSRRLVSLVGVNNIVVVDTPDALMVTTTEHAQDVKKMVEHMKLEGLDDAL